MIEKLLIEMDSELKNNIKVLAAKKRVTMKDLITGYIEEGYKKDIKNDGSL